MTKKRGTVAITFNVIRTDGAIVEVRTSSPEVNHFLRLTKQSRAYNTWLGYAYDLKAFFEVIKTPLRQIDRVACLAFIEQQKRAGYAQATVNRRLAAASALFNELKLLDPVAFPNNPVNPARHRQGRFGRNQSLYLREPERLPDIVMMDDLQLFLELLPTWRDRTIVLLMWLSCLRISEALGIEFGDIECSRRSIQIRQGKGGLTRTVFMEENTFAALNQYLDHERQDQFPNQPYVFVVMKGKHLGQRLKVNAFQKLIRYYADSCGMSGLHAHRFRHTGITQLVQNGMSEPAVRAFVGHRHPASLAPYLHLADAYVDQEFTQAQRGLNASITSVLDGSVLGRATGSATGSATGGGDA